MTASPACLPARLARCLRTAVLPGLATLLAAPVAAQAGAAPAGDDPAVWALAGAVMPGAPAGAELTAAVLATSGPARVRGALVTPRWQVAPGLSLAPWYAYLHVTAPGAPRLVEHRARVDATLAGRIGPVTLSDRNLVERRFLPARAVTVYRNRLRADVPVRPAGRSGAGSRVRAFASAEPFYDASAGRWARAFYAAGVDLPLGPVTAEAYYLRLDERRGADRDVLAVALLARVRAGRVEGQSRHRPAGAAVRRPTPTGSAP